MKPKVRADEILHALERYHTQRRKPDLFLTEVGTGSAWFDEKYYRLDALAIHRSWSNPRFTGYEVKVTRADFRKDNKWPAYLRDCHEFYFVCPTGVIEPEELPNEVGLKYFNPDKGSLTTRKKAVYRPIEIRWELLYAIILSQVESQKHPFFSDTRELLQAWVDDKETRAYLAIGVSRKLREVTEKNRELQHQLQRQVDALERYRTAYHELVGELKNLGIDINRWNWRETLRQSLSNLMPPDIVRELERIQNAATYCLAIIERMNRSHEQGA